ncbi:MAG: TrmJ/YjtD family RNA methyltransferase [Gemmatimonadota bacterium]|nr:TrmJ/YjtD family RNA methyltransferase [Gemmatimonadota bacterium]
MSAGTLPNVCVVLVEPQDPVNIAATARAMKNMGVATLRLVRPAPYEEQRLLGVAHGTGDIVRAIRSFDGLDDAIADCVFVAAYSARRRTAKRAATGPRAVAPVLLRASADGMTALIFGREDRGLANADLDRAHVIVTVPTTAHASLNLAQAVLLALYELHVAAESLTREIAPARKDAPAATSEQFERLFADVHRALDAIDFFKTRNPELILRTARTLAFRAAPDAREIELVRAMAIEVAKTLERVREPRT